MPADLGSSMRFQPTALLDALVDHENFLYHQSRVSPHGVIGVWASPLTQMLALCFVTASLSLLATTKAVATESSSDFDFLGAHVCTKKNFQFSIKILFKIRGRRREIWGSK